ncbi:unnamed protein product [Brassica oleracea var. botrytis]
MQVTKCSTNCLAHSFTNNFIILAFSVYMAELRMTHRHATEDELRQLRDNGFAAWLPLAQRCEFHVLSAYLSK